MQSGENSNIINRLFASFDDLDRAIVSARTSLAEKGAITESITKRLASYDEILAKQRSLATTLCEHINAGRWAEVTRDVSLINGLSSMIRDDAKAILTALSNGGVDAVAQGTSGSAINPEDEQNFC